MRKISRQTRAVARALADRLAKRDDDHGAALERWGKAYAAWLYGGRIGPPPSKPERYAGVPTGEALWEPVRFPGERRKPGEVLPRLRSTHELCVLEIVKKARRAKQGRARGVAGAREERKRQRSDPAVAAAQRRRDNTVRDLIRDGESSDREIVRLMQERGLPIGREKVAEIRRLMRPGGLARF